MSSDRKHLLRRYGALARTQALAFEHARTAAAVRDARTEEEIARDIGATDVAPVFRCGTTRFRLRPDIEHRHGGVLGATGYGKSVAVQELLLGVITRKLRSADPSATGRGRLGVEVLVVDIKDDIPRLARSLARIYATSSRPIQLLLERSVTMIEWQRHAVACQPLVVPREGVSNAYLAFLLADVIALTSEDAYSDSMRLVLVQLLRLFLDLGYPMDFAAATAVLTNSVYRAQLIGDSRVPRDLRDYFGNLERLVAPQTVAAFLRRLTTLMSFPELTASICLPPSAAPAPRPITLANCGTNSLLPRSLGIARAVAIIIDLVLDAGRRDPSVPLVAVIEELLSLLRNAPSVQPWFLDGLRLLRASGTSLWWAAQSLNGLPASAVEEIKNNLGWMLAFQSRGDVAETLFPHVKHDVRDRRGDHERRRDFTGEVENLPRQHAILWAKSAPAIHVTTLDAPEPSAASGIPAGELDAIFAGMSAGSTMPLASAEKIIEAWRAAHLPPPQRAAAAQSSTGMRRLILGEEGSE